MIFVILYFVSILSNIVCFRKNRNLNHNKNKAGSLVKIEKTKELDSLLTDLKVKKNSNHVRENKKNSNKEPDSQIIPHEFSTVSADDFNVLNKTKNDNEDDEVDEFDDNKVGIKNKNVKPIEIENVHNDPVVPTNPYNNESSKRSIKNILRKQLKIKQVINKEENELQDNIKKDNLTRTQIKKNIKEIKNLHSELSKLLSENEELKQQVKKENELSYEVNGIDEFSDNIDRKLRSIDKEYVKANKFLSKKKQGKESIQSILQKSLKKFKSIREKLSEYNEKLTFMVKYNLFNKF